MGRSKFFSIPGSPEVGVCVRCAGTIIAVCSMAMIVPVLLLLPVGLLMAAHSGRLSAVLVVAVIFLLIGSLFYGVFRFGVTLRNGGITTAHMVLFIGALAFFMAFAFALARNWAVALIGGFLFIALAPTLLAASVGDDAPESRSAKEDTSSTCDL